MSLQAAAQHLASKGRGPDTHLVHMAPSEVAGLQAIARAHGGTLTTNPHTGLPEAGFLSNILPMVIGAGLAAATGGTSLALSPGMIGLGIGGLETLRTGSLSKGLMAGLGAYGGAGLGAGMGLGATEAATAAAPAGAAPAGAGANIGASAAGAAAPANYSLLPQSQYAIPTPAGVGEGLRMGATEGLKAAATPINQLGSEAVKMSVPTITPPPESVSALDRLSAMPTKDKLQYGLAALTPALMQQNQAQYQGSGPNPYEYTYDDKTGQYTRVPTGTRDAMPQTPRTFFAAGGPVDEMSARNAALTLMADGGQMYAAGGGVSHLGDYSDGGRLLRGPGDGVSDSIPATIADKRPARLADGEFVVPARIVSELGNGSTEAGARKLYSMMDRIQKARSKTVGKDRVAVNSRADKALPA